MVPKKITSLSHHLLNLFGLYGLLIGDICLSIIAYHSDKTGWFCHIRGKYFAIEWTWKQRKYKSDLPIKEEIWSGGSCPLVGTLIPLALRTDFSIEIVLPLASWIWTTCEGSADYNVFVLFCLLNVKMSLFIYTHILHGICRCSLHGLRIVVLSSKNCWHRYLHRLTGRSDNCHYLLARCIIFKRDAYVLLKIRIWYRNNRLETVPQKYFAN